MLAPRVVVVGSINVDLVAVVARLPLAGETVAGGTFARYGGGKSANQAVAAARLGAAVSFVGAVGDDDLGVAALRDLADEGVDVTGLARVAGATGVALIVVDEAGENQIAVASGANAQLDPAHVTTALTTLLAPAPATSPTNAATALATAATTPTISPPATAAPRARPSQAPGVVVLCHEVSADVVSAAAQAANEAGWRVVLNPAPARDLPDAVLAVLTPNASEAAELTGCASPADAARALVEQTGAAVLITLGADGALLLEPGGEPVRLAATRVAVVDTTGAGDTVNGALATELAAGRPLLDAARFALTAAALSTTAAGARSGMPTREAVERAS